MPLDLDSVDWTAFAQLKTMHQTVALGMDDILPLPDNIMVGKKGGGTSGISSKVPDQMSAGKIYSGLEEIAKVILALSRLRRTGEFAKRDSARGLP